MFRHILRHMQYFVDSKRNSWLFHQHCFVFCWRKLVPKKVYGKMDNNSTLEKFLLVCNRNDKLLRLVGATFDSKVASFTRMRKKILIILKKLQKKSSPFFVLFVCRCWHLSCQISIESVRKIVICTLNVLMTMLYSIL